MRSTREWQAHPQSVALAELPLLEIADVTPTYASQTTVASLPPLRSPLLLKFRRLVNLRFRVHVARLVLVQPSLVGKIGQHF